MQIGDEKEILYLIAPSKKERKMWEDAFLQGENRASAANKYRDNQGKKITTVYNIIVATKKGNTMLARCHWGAYGSKATGLWSCCNESRKDALGCRSAATITRRGSIVSQASARSDDTLTSDTDSEPESSIRHSSSCSSGLSNYSS